MAGSPETACFLGLPLCYLSMSLSLLKRVQTYLAHLPSFPRNTMIALHDDEEDAIPLLQLSEQPMAKTPLPWDQFWIILFLQLSDPLVFETLAPFTPQLIRDIGVTRGDESQVGYFVGILSTV
ncbi:hypothetical protein DFH29DRAFT_371687 [Suillus ampliporus]|nr:hypothetical protein DFH29DRAFT_371687 [Suillus ampliporus]